MNLSMFFCSHFFKFKSQNDVEEVDAGKKTRRRICVGEIEASEFGMEQSEHESISMLDSGKSYSPGNYGMPSWNSDLTSIEKSVRGVNQRSSNETSRREVQHRPTESRLTHLNPKMFNRPYLEKVFLNVQKKADHPEDDHMLDLEVNVLICGLVMSQQQFISGWIIMQTCSPTKTPTSRSSRHCSISRRR